MTMDAEQNPSFKAGYDENNPLDQFEKNNEAAIIYVKDLNNRVQKIQIPASETEEYLNEAQYLLEKLINELSDCDTTFLTDYLNVLRLNNMSAISRATSDIISTIEMVISKEKEEGRGLQEPVMVVLVSWLCASMLWNEPRVPSARPALHALLPLLTEDEMQRVSDAWERCAPAALLLELSDAAGGALGARLLRAARRASACGSLLRLRVRGRELLAGDAAGDLMLPTLSVAITVTHMQKVLVISKLQKCFGKDPDNIVKSGSDSQGTIE